MTSLYIFLLFIATAALAQKPEPKLNVLVWDQYFDTNSNLIPEDGLPDEWGSQFYFSDEYPPAKDLTKIHGLQVSYVVLKENVSVRLHLAYNPAIPWQDPERCSLTNDTELNSELKKYGYPPLSYCHDKAVEGIKQLSKFIKTHHIKIVNMSHGVYYDNYVIRNPYILSDKYPNVNMDVIQKFLYKNFIEIGRVVSELFVDNPNVIFVLAAGNNGDEVDRDLYLKWYEDPMKLYPVPTMYASFTSQFDNLISLASSYDGIKLAGGSNYGKKNVFIAKEIGHFLVPDGTGKLMEFGGTSAAAAETTRLITKILLKYPNRFSPKEIKELIGQSGRVVPKLNDLVTTSAFIDEIAFLKLADAYLANSKSKFSNKDVTPVLLPVEPIAAEIKEYNVPDSINPKNYGCHSLVAENNSKIWMTLPWADTIAALDLSSGKFFTYSFSSQSHPDGITLDQNGNLWAGVDPNGGLVSVQSGKTQTVEFPHPKLSTLNITAADSRGRIWATGHRAQVISIFDPKPSSYRDWRVKMDWPLDIRLDDDGSAWVTAVKGFGVPWGSGALIHAVEGQDLEYFPLPESEEKLMAYWLAVGREKILITLMRDGLMLFDKKSKSMTHLKRSDNLQVYNIARLYLNRYVVLANSHDKMKSIDFLDLENPSEIKSIILKNQIAEPREALAFDTDDNIWFCQTFSNILAKVTLKNKLNK